MFRPLAKLFDLMSKYGEKHHNEKSVKQVYCTLMGTHADGLLL